MGVNLQRDAAIARTVERVCSIVAAKGETPEALDLIVKVLGSLAEHADLFTFEDFPLPKAGSGTENCLYRLSEDPDHRFALYVNVSRPGKSSAPHNHTTWAVVVGVRGEELNRLYRREDDGSIPGHGKVTQTGEVNVTPRNGIRFMPDDIHSIHVVGKEPILHFHMYGRGLEQLTGRIGFDTAHGTYKVYPPHRDIRVAQ